MKRYGVLFVLAVALFTASCAQPTPSPTQVAAGPTSAPATVAAPTTVAPSAAATATAPAASPTVQPPTDTATAPSATTLPPSATPAPPSATALPPTATPLPSAKPSPAATATAALPLTPNAAVGAKLWQEYPCAACHGVAAEGDSGPRVAGTGLSIEAVRSRVRLGKGQMPAFTEDEVSDLGLAHIYAWLRSLAKPAPTPIAAPSFPTQSLLEMWSFVNEMRIRADFAKDLPVRVAQDDAGRLEIVKQYSRDGLLQCAQVIDRANRALNEVPLESVRGILREIIQETNTVADRFNQALAQGSYPAAWGHVAEAVRICRLDTQPWAAQAVRDAGLVGTVRLRVVDQRGAAIPGAFATVLTAHEPYGARADGAGVVVFRNVAAVPAIQAKAYVAGRVYHEININLAPGQTVAGTIALPPLPGPNLAPQVAGASISPASGAGNATVTFAVTATDPQGALDLAEDQIFALNPDVGTAYVLRAVGNNRYQSTRAMPNLAAGTHIWHFFAVDHECHTSAVIPVRYSVK